MPACPCPDCESMTARWLEESSKHAWVSYYRCTVCGCVWTYPKGQELTAKPTIVSSPRQKP